MVRSSEAGIGWSSEALSDLSNSLELFLPESVHVFNIPSVVECLSEVSSLSVHVSVSSGSMSP